MMTMTQIDVLIIGAGPVGLTAANLLTKQGVSCMIVDQLTERSPYSKAFGIQPRTLEMLHLLGVSERFIDRGYPAAGARIHFGHQSPATVEFGSLHTPYPYIFVLSQAETENILEAYLSEQGVTVQRNTSFFHLEQNDQESVVTLQHKDSFFSIQARYVLACDGAHSSVREKLRVPFKGSAHHVTYFLGDVKATNVPHDGYLNAFLTDSGVGFCLPLGNDVTRLITIDSTQQQRSHQLPLTLDEFQQSVNRIFPWNITIQESTWLSQFGTAEKLVSSYRKGNVFFLGDAAHVHSPLGGQGMNTGIQDAANLSWKLASVLKGHSPLSLLNSYEKERRPIARTILRSTTMGLRAATLQHKFARQARNNVGKRVIGTSVAQEQILARLMNLSFSYKRCYKTLQDPHLSRTSIQPGDRLPDMRLLHPNGSSVRLYDLLQKYGFLTLLYRDAITDQELDEIQHLSHRYPGHVSVITKGGPSKKGVSHLYDDKRALHRYAEPGSYLLIRPDGYVGVHASSLSSFNEQSQFFLT